MRPEGRVAPGALFCSTEFTTEFTTELSNPQATYSFSKNVLDVHD